MTAKFITKQKTTLLLSAAAVILLIIIAFFLVKIGQYYQDARRTEELYQTLANATPAIPEPAFDDLQSREISESVSFSSQIAAAQAQNSDVVGWIKINDTSINYSILQGDNNTYYLKHNLLGDSSSHAAIMMDTLNSPENPFIILYGHNMRNGTMFHDLVSYKDASFYASHPIIQLETATGYGEYRIFSVMIITSAKDIPPAVMPKAEREVFIAGAVSQSLYDTDVTVDSEDRIIMLTTCTYETTMQL